ncbi:MAG: molecular chaperone [Candidatus Eisenbacteria bacterium]|nr:molecular chaperone [Candidatus Eisenbacteria bacterium]
MRAPFETTTTESLAPQPPLPAVGAGGMGGLLVGPTRVVFEGGVRSAQLTLVNTGARMATYRLRIIRMRMTETGEIREIQDAEGAELFADSLVRFSPRRVELAPQVPQTVRLQLRKPADLPPGEYRSHLLIQALPEQAGEDSSDLATRTLTLRLKPVFGVSVPVIVRHGETRASIRLSEVSLDDPAGAPPQERVRVVLDREGNRSVYGDLTAVLESGPGEREVVGLARGVAVYAPNPRRVFLLPLRLPRDRPPTATLHISFAAAPGAGEGPHAEATLPLR